ncbi:hypothetical protein BAE39_30270 [Mesorhizobium loti]|uniref:Uncharacterized protein n=1 Tax=Rhizobium loti TaxID=381 RepID=A0A1A5IHY0_RHILI|nr:hypothetical protein BAE39_30270 [Mesorhizobium loti]
MMCATWITKGLPVQHVRAILAARKLGGSSHVHSSRLIASGAQEKGRACKKLETVRLAVDSGRLLDR